MNNEYTPDLYELEDENGEKTMFEMLDAMEYEGETYYALTPFFDEEQGDEMLEDSGEVVILKSEYDENGEKLMVSIDDDELYEKIGNIFIDRIQDMFEFEDECDDEDCDCGCHNHDITQ